MQLERPSPPRHALYFFFLFFGRSVVDTSAFGAPRQACKTASDPWLGPCGALTTLLQASKKACQAVVKSKGFALPKAGTPAGKSELLYEQSWCGWVGLGWIGLGWLGLAWRGLAWLGLAWLGLAWAGLGWVGLAWLGLAWLVLCCVVLCICFALLCSAVLCYATRSCAVLCVSVLVLHYTIRGVRRPVSLARISNYTPPHIISIQQCGTVNGTFNPVGTQVLRCKNDASGPDTTTRLVRNSATHRPTRIPTLPHTPPTHPRTHPSTHAPAHQLPLTLTHPPNLHLPVTNLRNDVVCVPSLMVWARRTGDVMVSCNARFVQLLVLQFEYCTPSVIPYPSI